MKNWKIWTAFLTVFIAGISVGVFGSGLYVKHRLHPRNHNPAEFHKIIKERMLSHIQNEVHPSPEIMPAIESILDETLDKARDLRREVHPRIKTILEDGQSRIKALLPPEQQERFEAFTKRLREQPHKYLPPPPPPPR